MVEIKNKDLRVFPFKRPFGKQRISMPVHGIKVMYVPLGIIVECNKYKSNHLNFLECKEMIKENLRSDD